MREDSMSDYFILVKGNFSAKNELSGKKKIKSDQTC